MSTLELEKSVTFQNILIATDFSKASQAAVKYGAGLAREHGAKLHVLNVVPPVARLAVPLDSLPQELDQAIAESHLQLQKLAASELTGVSEHEELVSRGHVLQVVNEMVADRRIDLLVIGTRGRSAGAQLLLGSVAEELFRYVTCPVLTVGPSIQVERDPKFQRVVFATDFGPASADALPYAIDLARQGHGELIALHVVAPAPASAVGPFWHFADEVIEAQKTLTALAYRKLDFLLPANLDIGCKVTKLVACHFITEAILKTCYEEKADVMVMGVNQASSMMAAVGKAHIPWTTAHEIVRNATCPVLTVRAQ